MDAQEILNVVAKHDAALANKIRNKMREERKREERKVADGKLRYHISHAYSYAEGLLESVGDRDIRYYKVIFKCLDWALDWHTRVIQ